VGGESFLACSLCLQHFIKTWDLIEPHKILASIYLSICHLVITTLQIGTLRPQEVYTICLKSHPDKGSLWPVTHPVFPSTLSPLYSKDKSGGFCDTVAQKQWQVKPGTEPRLEGCSGLGRGPGCHGPISILLHGQLSAAVISA
jgi:hypothetical protein